MENEAAFRAGRAVRRDVLGPDYADAAIEEATPFMRPMQRLVTEFCWGSVWARPGLPRRTRSLLNLAMLTALGKTEELSLHVRAAVQNNGCTVAEVQEVLLQASVYCGVPAGLNAFRIAEAVLDEHGFTAEDAQAVDV